MKKRRRSSKIAMMIIVSIVLFMCLLFMVKTHSMSLQKQAMEEQLAQIERDTAIEKQRTEVIKDEIKYRETDDYIEDTARDSLGLRYPDEIILLPEKDD